MGWPKGVPRTAEQRAKTSTSMLGKVKGTAEERFWAKVNKTNTCWLWTGHLNNKGYGDFHFGSGSAHCLAHVFSWKLANGELEDGRIIMHSCDVPACVNPAHLVTGTMKDNSVDMSRKGRAGQQKLSNTDLEEIVASLDAGARRGALAREFGVAPITLDRALDKYKLGLR